MYRLDRSIIAGHPAVQRAFRAHGVRDYATAFVDGAGPMPTRTQVFVMDDGRVVPSDGQLVSAIAREIEGARQ